MNLLDQQRYYLISIDTVENMDTEPKVSPTTLQTFYELNRYRMDPKKAYKEAWKHFRTLMHNLNNQVSNDYLQM